MAITPIVVPAIGFMQFDGSDPNIAFDPTNTRAINQFIETGDLTKLSSANISAALRSIFSAIIGSFQKVQVLENDVAVLTAQKEFLESNLQTLQADLETLQADPEALQADIDAIQADIDTVQADIDTVVNQIAAKQVQLAAAKAVPSAAIMAAQQLSAQLESDRYKETRTQISSDRLLDAALASPRDADKKANEKENARLVDEFKDLNYEKYKEVVYDLVREILASRAPETEETVRLTPKQVRNVFFEFGVDPRDIDVSAGDTITDELLEPITEIVALYALQQEISALKKVGIPPANEQVPRQTVLLAPAHEAPTKRDHERGNANYLTSEDPLELDDAPVELEKLEDSVFLTPKTLFGLPLRTLSSLIEAKIAQANALKAQIQERLGLELTFMVAGGSDSPMVDPFAPLDTDKSTDAEAENLSAHVDDVKNSQENPGSGSRTASSDDQKDLRLNSDWIRIPI